MIDLTYDGYQEVAKKISNCNNIKSQILFYLDRKSVKQFIAGMKLTIKDLSINTEGTVRTNTNIH